MTTHRWQKVTLGILFLLVCWRLGESGISRGSDLTALGAFVGAIAAGMLTIVWGNVKEHQARADAIKRGGE